MPCRTVVTFVNTGVQLFKRSTAGGPLAAHRRQSSAALLLLATGLGRTHECRWRPDRAARFRQVETGLGVDSNLAPRGAGDTSAIRDCGSIAFADCYGWIICARAAAGGSRSAADR